MSAVITEYIRSTERQEALAEMETEAFDIDSMKYDDYWFRNKPNKNSRARKARREAKQKGFSY
jgi:hypothetical protein